MILHKTFPIEPLPHLYSHKHLIQVWGSCFADEMYKYLLEGGYRVFPSPFGTMYNPLSIASGILSVLEGKQADPELFTERDGSFYSYMHHSRISGESSEALASAVNERSFQNSIIWKHTRLLVATWGTAYVYYKDGVVVNNCHKQPEKLFERRLVTIEEIVATWEELLQNLWTKFPDLCVLLTVSPIRHYRDGIHSNTLSKATLQLAIEQLRLRYPERIFYFPSYEILLDELRDYRFYAEDMAHPSSLAISYIMEKAKAFMLDPASFAFAEEWRKAYRLAKHTPSEKGREAHQREVYMLFESLRTERDTLYPPFTTLP
ncbi:MAG: GSCFA domain-containing protein [Porphyromonas sp.]|nr:GSCFA domain-containing protein [Porphyromonas sp.]